MRSAEVVLSVSTSLNMHGGSFCLHCNFCVCWAANSTFTAAATQNDHVTVIKVHFNIPQLTTHIQLISCLLSSVLTSDNEASLN